MEQFKVDKASVDKEKYQVYINVTTNDIIAIDREIEMKKIELAHENHKLISNIPDSEIVKGCFLKKNIKTHKYEMLSGHIHEDFKIKDLYFASSNIIWE